MPKSFLDFLESMTIALEADDITQQTTNEVRSALGGEPLTQQDTVNPDEEDLEKVDDIFDLQDNASSDGPSGNPQEDVEGGAEDLPPNEEDLNENSNEDEEPSGEEDPNISGNGNENQPSDQEPVNDDLAFAQKNRIRDNLIQLHTIISGEIEIIVNSLSNINDENTLHVLNLVLNHLRNSKSYLYKTLTQNIQSLEYDELLQRYITIKRIYDICTQMLEKYSENANKKNKTKR